MRLDVNQQQLKEVIKRLEVLPQRIINNAMSSALTAGAAVVRDRARAKAPACLAKTIKTKRRRGKKDFRRVSVVAGAGDHPDFYNDTLKKLYGAGESPSKKMKDKIGCKPAFWYEFGTYQYRDLVENPYSPETFRTHPAYRRLGHTDSPFWGSWAKSWAWTPETPFLRPAIQSAATDGSVERAMAAKLKSYLDKKGY